MHEFEIVWISSFSLCALSWIERNIRIFITEFISHEYVRNANAAGSRPRLSLCHFFCPTGKGGNFPFKYFSEILKVWLFTLATRKSWHWSSESICKETKALHFRKMYFLMHFFMKSKSRLKWQNINIQKLCQDTFILKVVIHTIFTKRDHYQQQGELNKVFHRNTKRSNINSAFSRCCENSEQLRSGIKHVPRASATRNII